MFKNDKHKLDPFRWRIGLPYPFGPKVEDPVRVTQFSETLRIVDPTNSGNEIFALVGELANAEIRYYYLRRVQARRLSTLLHYMAWLFGTVGILVPVAGHILSDLPENFLSWGYYFFALAGSVLVADNVFGGTNSHHRYVKTQLDIERIFELYALDAKRIFVSNILASDAEKSVLLIDRSVEFIEQMHLVLGTETAEWKKAVDLTKLELQRHAGGPGNQCGSD